VFSACVTARAEASVLARSLLEEHQIRVRAATSRTTRRSQGVKQIGRGLAERGRHEEALACYDRALAIRRDVPQLLSNRGNALRNLGRFDEAETSLREALRLKPDFANAHRNLGRVLVDLGRWEEAAASVRTALRLQPDLPDALYDLGEPKPNGAIARPCASDRNILNCI
jgi:protein O-GlcNAc transferase